MDIRLKGDRITDNNHIARYCRPSQIDNGKIQASAFFLREDEDGLSVNWLDFLNCTDRDSEVCALKLIYSNKFSVGKTAKIAIIQVGQMCNKVRMESHDRRNLSVVHAPSFDDESHSEIYNLRPDNELIAELILETILESYPAR